MPGQAFHLALLEVKKVLWPLFKFDNFSMMAEIFPYRPYQTTDLRTIPAEVSHETDDQSHWKGENDYALNLINGLCRWQAGWEDKYG